MLDAVTKVSHSPFVQVSANRAQIAELVGQIESTPDNATSYAILNRCYDFNQPSSSHKATFCHQAPARLLEKHRDVIVELKTQVDRRKREQQSFISRACSAVFGGIGEYFQEVGVAWKLTNSENPNHKRLGWEITIVKTLGYSPFITGMVMATAFTVAAIALPFFATSLGIVGVGALSHYLTSLALGAVFDVGLGLMQKIYMDYMWEDELEDFQPFVEEHRLKLFIEHHLEKGFEGLKNQVSNDTYDRFKTALCDLS